MMNYEQYYLNSYVQVNLVQSAKFRETAFLNFDNLPNGRNIIVRDVMELLKNMKYYHFFSRKYNIYSSVARFDFAKMRRDTGFPPFSFHPKIRATQRTQFNEIAKDYIIAYDLVLDFDIKNDNFDECYSDVSLVKNQFDIKKIPYILKFSGNGFHIIIPNKYLPERTDKPKFCKDFASEISQIYDLSTLDLSIFDARRVIKTPYSLDVKTGYVCFPLSNREFDTFSKDMCLPDNVMASNIFLKNSGIREGLSDAFRNYIKELEIGGDEYEFS